MKPAPPVTMIRTISPLYFELCRRWLRMERYRLLMVGAAAAIVLGSFASAQQSGLYTGRSRTMRVSCTALDILSSGSAGTSFACVLDRGGVLEVAIRGAAPFAGSHLLLRGRLDAFDGPRNPEEAGERIMA